MELSTIRCYRNSELHTDNDKSYIYKSFFVCRRMFPCSSIICPFWVPLTHISLNPEWSRMPVGKDTCQTLIHYHRHVCEDYLPLRETLRSSVSRPHSCMFRGRHWSKTGSKHFSFTIRLCECRPCFALSSFWLSWGFLQKTLVVQLLKNFRTFLWNPKFRYSVHKSPPPFLILSQIKAVYTTPSCLKSILILSSHLRVGLPSDLFPVGFPTKILPALLLSSTLVKCSADHIFLTWSF
jgi:hypothetical protein